MLQHLLSSEDYSLALSPGFFRFYAHIGVLAALKEKGCLRPNAVSGSSAGALVGCFVAAGMTPEEMIEHVLKIKRADMWDMGGIGGLLKGHLFNKFIHEYLPYKTFEECPIPLGVTAYDLIRFKTKSITSGTISNAVVASCTFPGLFQPVIIDGTPHIDGGVWDDSGLMSLPEAIASRSVDNKKEDTDKLIVNVVFSGGPLHATKLPKALKGRRLLTIVMENIPMVHPFSMDTMGEVAYNVSKAATLRALDGSHMQEVEPNHWVCWIDGNITKAVDTKNNKRPLDADIDETSNASSKKSKIVHQITRVPSLSFVNGSFDALSEATHCCPVELKQTEKINRGIVSSGSLDKIVLSDFIAPPTTTSNVAKVVKDKKIIDAPAPPVRVVSASTTSTVTAATSDVKSRNNRAVKSRKSPVRKGSVQRFKKSVKK